MMSHMRDIIDQILYRHRKSILQSLFPSELLTPKTPKVPIISHATNNPAKSENKFI